MLKAERLRLSIVLAPRRHGEQSRQGSPPAMLNNARKYVWLVALALTSCSGSVDDDSDARRPVGSVVQPLTDTDSDEMDDDWEIQHFGNLGQTGSGDFDSDGMT